MESIKRPRSLTKKNLPTKVSNKENQPNTHINSPKKEVSYRISWTTAFLMISLTIVFDLTEIIIDWLGNLTAAFGLGLLFWGLNIGGVIFMGLTFFVWFKIKNIPIFTSPKRIATSAITFIGEMIPVINNLPGWTIGIIVIIIISRSEDRGGIIGKATSITKNLKGKASVGKKG